MNIHHVSIGVRDLNNSKAFYNNILGALGYRPYMEKPGTASWKPIQGGAAFWINKRSDVITDSNNGSHIAFEANSQKQVDQFYELAIKAGALNDGRFIEKIGTYNPMLQKEDPARVNIDIDRAKHWLGVGALPSERVAKFLANVDLIKTPERREQTKQQLPKKKAQERLEAEQEALTVKEAPATEEVAEEEAPALYLVKSPDEKNYHEYQKYHFN